MSEQCPVCGGLVRLGWEDGTRVCIRGHRFKSKFIFEEPVSDLTAPEDST
ncbi:TFIIB-type zinc finger domain-containing protein [Natrinema gari]|nr:TFIIB-type zinc finger domain-containing protein [Natrinema gari]